MAYTTVITGYLLYKYEVKNAKYYHLGNSNLVEKI